MAKKEPKVKEPKKVLTKEEKAALKIEKRKARKASRKALFEDFKAFLNRGNAFMLAVGVVIGGAFSAIVTAFTSILMNLVTAATPGGVDGLVVGIHTKVAIVRAEAAGVAAENLEIGAKEWLALETAERGLYKAYGGRYFFNAVPILDFGALINAILSFFIVGLVLFICVKLFAAAAKKKAALEAKAREAYYKKHPEERPVEPEPEAPKPTQEELLTAILAELKKQNEPQE